MHAANVEKKLKSRDFISIEELEVNGSYLSKKGLNSCCGVNVINRIIRTSALVSII